MKNILLIALIIYQKYISPLFHQLSGGASGCRQIPTCSEYSKEVITEFGVTKGVFLSMKRVINCQPLFSL